MSHMYEYNLRDTERFGNPDNPKTINLSADDAQVHLNNHDLDFLGSCED